MKVSRIEIKDFQQFKDFELDLTYPEGHAKAGQPLDKVCFIGQSGTGKTTILNVISDLVFTGVTNRTDKYDDGNLIYRIDYSVLGIKNTGFYLKFLNKEQIELYDGGYNFTWGKEFDIFFVKGNRLKNRVIFFETGLENYSNSLIGAINEEKPLLHTEINIEQLQAKINTVIDFYTTLLVVKSNQSFNHENFRLFLLKNLDNYDRILKAKLQELFTKAFNNNVAKILNEVQSWKTENLNPRIEIAKKLSSILSKFNLKIDEEWADGGLKLKTLQDTEVQIGVASTGTKQILLSAIPLIFMETQHKIILFDEPERSLFPDVQRTLIKYYTELAPEAQFFFATHSPIIASQFEPCERFILTFDEETGFVEAHRGIAPEGDDPNDVLFKDFGMKTIMGEKGIAAWERFIELRMLIREEKNDTKKEQFANEYLSLQRAYNF